MSWRSTRATSSKLAALTRKPPRTTFIAGLAFGPPTWPRQTWMQLVRTREATVGMVPDGIGIPISAPIRGFRETDCSGVHLAGASIRRGLSDTRRSTDSDIAARISTTSVRATGLRWRLIEDSQADLPVRE